MTRPLAALDALVLARLHAAGDGGHTRSHISRAVQPFLAHRLGASACAERIDTALAALAADQDVSAPRPRAFRIAASGRERLCAYLGAGALPAPARFETLRDVDLTARALGLPNPRGAERRRFRTADGLRAALLKRHHALLLADFPTLTQARDALAWKHLGELLARPLPPRGQPRFGPGAGLRTLLSALASPTGPLLDKPLEVLAARCTGAPKPDARSLRLAALRGWVDGEEAAPKPTAAPAAGPEDLAAFARDVTTAAEHSGDGRFGERLVFIAAVWDALVRDGRFAAADKARFQELLAQANNARLLSLRRADLVEAMDPGLVAASETRYLNATFHFVRLER